MSRLDPEFGHERFATVSGHAGRSRRNCQLSIVNRHCLGFPTLQPRWPLSQRSEFWSAIREALRGSRQDYTEGPIGRSIMLLAVPMVLEMMMESVFAVADIFFVGRLGADAVATVGITESLMTIIYAVAIGLSIGAAATVARRIGEKDPERAASACRGAVGGARRRRRCSSSA